MKIQTNRNVDNILNQINNSLELLVELRLAVFFNPIHSVYDKTNNISKLTWNNHVSGRETSANAFTSVKQYLSILKSGAFHALLQDYSIIRVSFKFEGPKLISQNLLWWPCPVRFENDEHDEYTPAEIVELYLSEFANLQMRSPIRIDFDSENDKEDHPKAHLHTQHYESRMNTVRPICFNEFLKFIFNHYYPHIIFDNSKFSNIPLNYEKGKSIEYLLKEKMLISG